MPWEDGHWEASQSGWIAWWPCTAYVLIFTCATSRAVHLELTRSQTAEEFQRKLNAFITRRTRPEKIVSDNAATFKATATWIERIRKSEKLQNYLAQQEITWQFNLSKSPWWGGMYERLIKEVKKTAYKTLGNTHLTFQQLEVVIMDIEKHLNNRPLTYVGVRRANHKPWRQTYSCGAKTLMTWRILRLARRKLPSYTDA